MAGPVPEIMDQSGICGNEFETLSAILTYAALYLWFVQFLQCKETSTGELCENLLTVWD
jgi:hypothetical protein